MKEIKSTYPSLKDINFAISETLLAQFKALQNKYQGEKSLQALHSPELIAHQVIDIALLHQDFKKLLILEKKFNKPYEKNIIKQYQLTIIEAIETHLNERVLGNSQKHKKESSFFFWIRQFLFFILLIAGLILDGVGSFLGTQQIFNLFLAKQASIIIGVIFGAINTLTFFEGNLIPKTMRSQSTNSIASSYELDKKQLEATQKINRMLNGPCHRKLNIQTYAAFAAVAGSFNISIANKKKNLRPPKGTALQLILRAIVTAVSIFMQISSSYFLSSALITFIAPALIGTPPGWGIIAFGVFTYLFFFFASRTKAIQSVFNPERDKFNMLKSDLDRFDPTTSKDFNLLYYNARSVTNISQQIEEEIFIQNKMIQSVKIMLPTHLDNKIKQIQQQQLPTAVKESIAKKNKTDTEEKINRPLLWKKTIHGWRDVASINSSEREKTPAPSTST